MAVGTKYHQKLASCEAIKYSGTNAADVVTFAPGFAFLEDGKLVLRYPPNGYVEVQVGWYIVSNEYPKNVFTFSFSNQESFETAWEVKV